MRSFNPINRNTLSGHITIALYRISQAISHLLRQRGEIMGLSPAQIQALIFMRYARSGIRTIGGLADWLAVSYPTASGITDALERKHLAERLTHADDRRIVTLSLTEQGERSVHALEDVLDEIEQAIETLPEGDRQALYRATQAIVKTLQAAGHVKVYEMCWGCQFFQRDAHPDDPRGPHHCGFMDAPLPEPETYRECPDFIPIEI
jgi:DNA-binding MarR family transcriptional regulator